MFIKRKESFVCQKCNREVVGDGYTNHCPECLWSRHVDIEPGDRMCSCGGLMEPIAKEQTGREWQIVHKCQKCDFKRKNKLSKGDNFDQFIKIKNTFTE